jgi:hypothetical protein
MRTYVWRGLDEPRMEIAYVDGPEHARGTQLGAFYELRWELDGDTLDLRIVGGEHRTLTLDGADFFDVFASAYFNSLPVLRDGLLGPGPRPARDYTMNFVRVPELTASLVAQRYEPRGDRVVHYQSGTYEADIEFDQDGIVTRYEGFLERLDG